MGWMGICIFGIFWHFLTSNRNVILDERIHFVESIVNLFMDRLWKMDTWRTESSISIWWFFSNLFWLDINRPIYHSAHIRYNLYNFLRDSIEVFCVFFDYSPSNESSARVVNHQSDHRSGHSSHSACASHSRRASRTWFATCTQPPTESSARMNRPE